MNRCFFKKALSLLAILTFLLCSCGKSDSNTNAFSNSSSGNGISSNNSSGNGSTSSDGSTAASSEKGSWDNTPNVLIPTASGVEVHTCDSCDVDTSNKSEGYIIANYHGTNEKVKLQITGSDAVTYTYDLHGGDEVFPLTSGSGSYSIGVYENIEGTQYASVLSVDVSADITNEFGPYLYPNQYVDFSSDSQTVSKGSDLAYSCNSDIEVVESVYNYIISNISYDYDKSESVSNGSLVGYLPVVDSILASGKGICFDYAAVMATMLRSQSIPTRLEVGYRGEEYHAWISTYIKNVGWVNGIIEFDGSDWNLLDPTYASTSSSPQNFVTDDNDYITKYVY